LDLQPRLSTESFVKILLFGGNGQVGWELQRALCLFGNLIMIDKRTANLENYSRLAAVVEAEAPNIVVNAAAYTAVDRAENDAERAHLINAVAVEQLARAAHKQQFLLIHYSTDYVFDGQKTLAYRENDPTGAISIYGKTKCAGDEAILASGCEHLIFRTSWVHSARGSNFVRKILQLASEKSSLAVVADQFGAPTSAELLADVTALAIARHNSSLALRSGLYNLTSSGVTSWHAFACFIVREALLQGYDLLVRPENIRAISSSEFQAAAPRPRNSVMDTSKLSDALNISFPDWTHHARRTVLEILESRGAHGA
jgi:dTDP-4-dehydrorhamnose reductase